MDNFYPHCHAVLIFFCQSIFKGNRKIVSKSKGQQVWVIKIERSDVMKQQIHLYLNMKRNVFTEEDFKPFLKINTILKQSAMFGAMLFNIMSIHLLHVFF